MDDPDSPGRERRKALKKKIQARISASSAKIEARLDEHLARKQASKQALKQELKKEKRAAAHELLARLGKIGTGIEALAEKRKLKKTLRTHSLEYKPAPRLTPDDLVRIRTRLNLSRALFAACLRTNVRTLENWEQGRAYPNEQAVLLISLVRKFPDTVERLAAI